MRNHAAVTVDGQVATNLGSAQLNITRGGGELKLCGDIQSAQQNIASTCIHLQLTRLRHDTAGVTQSDNTAAGDDADIVFHHCITDRDVATATVEAQATVNGRRTQS